MINIISIYKINGIKFQEIKYDNINNLSNQLTILINRYNSDILYNYYNSIYSKKRIILFR